ncbi:MAG: GxxExxY protein [Gemmatimonadaceae bacterium]
MSSTLLHGHITEKIIGVFYEVHWELGPGFLESIYANGMACALGDAGLTFDRERAVTVRFRSRAIGVFRADMIVEKCVLVEFKAGPRLDPTAEAQTINYLRATGLEVALILHFGLKPVFKRIVETPRT